MRLRVVLVAVVVVSALLPPGDLFGTSSAGAQTTELCDTGSVAQFTDVGAADYATAYILCMRALELSRGSGGGAYGPDRDLTRGQMASFLVRLWRDVLANACPEGPASPFADIARDAHEANIECLYALGITKGTTATTYSPNDPLKASQISRFLLRTYKRAGHTCPTTGGDGELGEAVNCLLALRVIPTTAEGRSTDTVNRAQMAVNVIGLWHNLTGRGLPPAPPKKTATTTPTRRINPGITAGGSHSCALAFDNTITCWGNNGSGQTDAPIGIYKTVTAGGFHSCALAADDAITCWGDNWVGQIDAPVGKYRDITTGSVHNCAIKTDDTITCWGYNEYGETNAPTGVYKAVTASPGKLSCAIAFDDTITCWGNNDSGQANAPSGKYKTVTGGTWHTCAIAFDDTISCWGNNDSGQADAPSGKYKNITTGAAHNCAIKANGTITCWGNNDSGQADAPSGKYKTVAAGAWHTCAIAFDDTISCWGRNKYGESDAPSRVPAIINTTIDGLLSEIEEYAKDAFVSAQLGAERVEKIRKWLDDPERNTKLYPLSSPVSDTSRSAHRASLRVDDVERVKPELLKVLATLLGVESARDLESAVRNPPLSVGRGLLDYSAQVLEDLDRAVKWVEASARWAELAWKVATALCSQSVSDQIKRAYKLTEVAITILGFASPVATVVTKGLSALVRVAATTAWEQVSGWALEQIVDYLVSDELEVFTDGLIFRKPPPFPAFPEGSGVLKVCYYENGIQVEVPICSDLSWWDRNILGITCRKG